MNNSRPIVNISLLLGTIIAVSAFFLVFNNIPVQALHKEQQLLESFDDLADFAKAVKSGDEEIEDIPIQSMKAADIYDDADDNLKDCIDQAAEIGDSLTDREVVHCVDDVNYFNNKYSNSTVPTNATSTATTGLVDTGADTTSTSNAADTTSTSNAADTTSTSNAADTTSTSNAADTTSTSDNSNENNLVDELVKTGKFTEAEAREFVSNNMQSGTGTDTTSDIKTSNAVAGTNTADTETSNADTNTANTETSNADTNTDSSASDDTSSSNNEDNNNQSSNNNSNNPEDYDDLNELVNDIKNGDVDTDKISLSAFQDSGAYQGADQETQDCIDLAGKIGNNLGDQEIVNCSEDPNFYRNEISNNNDNNADDSSSNNADDSSSNNADDSSSNNNN
jgi:polyhydroxyalkanoate synthesis regulator phasin